jgi:hypothetical protein
MIQSAEARLPAQQRRKLSTIEGIVPVSADHGAYHTDSPAVQL